MGQRLEGAAQHSQPSHEKGGVGKGAHEGPPCARKSGKSRDFV